MSADRKLVGVSVDFDAFHWLRVKGNLDSVTAVISDATTETREAIGLGLVEVELLDGSKAMVRASSVRALREVWEEPVLEQTIEEEALRRGEERV